MCLFKKGNFVSFSCVVCAGAAFTDSIMKKKFNKKYKGRAEMG